MTAFTLCRERGSTMSNIKCSWDDVLHITAEYLNSSATETARSLPVEKLYEMIVDFAENNYPDEVMPKFSQARSIFIRELADHHLFEKGERFNASALFRLIEIPLYYDRKDIEQVIRFEYEVSYYAESAIVCILKLPPSEIMSGIFEGISEKKKHSQMWGKIDSIRKICDKLKKRDPENILAVVPESNRMIYLNPEGQVNTKMIELDPVSDTILMFVKNTPSGQELVERMSLQR